MESKNKHDFPLPFGIEFVVKEDLATLEGYREWKASGSSFDITCPFCGGKRKMNINTSKNVARCNKCGGAYGYNTITLHAALTGLSNSESYKDLMRRWNKLGSDVKVAFAAKAKVNSGNEPAPIEIRDAVYRRLLNNLSLSDNHFEDLKKRGLSEAEIAKGMYKSVPVVGLHSLAYDAVYNSGIIKSFSTHKYWGIPGFTDIKNPNEISIRSRKSGYFIPVVQKDGLISGMQIRYDSLPDDATEKERESYKKYSWYSSSEKESGCSVTNSENIHFAGNWKTIPKVINLTEGVLKADVASALSGKPFLGLVGVNNTSQLEETLIRLQYLGSSLVNLYIDMDYKEKKEVASALLAIKKIVNKTGRHAYVIKGSDSLEIRSFDLKIQIPEEGLKKGIKILSSKEFPQTAMAFLGKSLIPREKFFIQGCELQIEYDYINCIRNSVHTLRIFDASNGFDDWNDLSCDERQHLLKDTLAAEITFEKTGLKYNEINWNDNYKGIDDYYLHLKNLNSDEII